MHTKWPPPQVLIAHVSVTLALLRFHFTYHDASIRCGRFAGEDAESQIYNAPVTRST